MALPPQVDLDKFLRVAITALQQAPHLFELDRPSLFASIVTAAQLGLLPDAQLGEAYFMPFAGKVQLVPGYRGLIKLARQGDIGQVEAEIICEYDSVEFQLGDESRLGVLVNWQNRGEMVAVYAIAKYRDGSICARTVMTKEEVDAIREQSPNRNGPAWKNHYEEMAKKTALRRLAKYLPLTTEAQNAFRVSEMNEQMGRPSQVIDGQVVSDPEAAPSPLTPPAEPRKAAIDQFAAPPKPEAKPAPAPRKTFRSALDAGRPPSADNDRPPTVDPDTGAILDGPPPPDAF